METYFEWISFHGESFNERYVLLIWISDAQFAIIQGEEKTDHLLRVQELAWNRR